MADKQQTTTPQRVSDDDLRELIEFIEMIVDANMEFAQKFDVTNLAALRELALARPALEALQNAREALLRGGHECERAVSDDPWYRDVQAEGYAKQLRALAELIPPPKEPRE